MIAAALAARGAAMRWKIDPVAMPADFTGEAYLQSCWVYRV